MKRRGARLFTFKVSMGGPQLLSRHWRRAGGAALEVLGGLRQRHSTYSGLSHVNILDSGWAGAEDYVSEPSLHARLYSVP